MREGNTGNCRGRQVLRRDLLADGEGSGGGRGLSPEVATSLSPKGWRQRGNLYPLHFPHPPAPEQNEQERFSGAGLSSSDTFSIPDPTLGQPPSSPRAGIQISRLTAPGCRGLGCTWTICWNRVPEPFSGPDTEHLTAE